jgi:UDP-N-acetylmuramoyl-L-alanyl-D-glutamate--2,6-diaminopimelate ligase
MMKLEMILQNIDPVSVSGNLNRDISAVVFDSRTATPGCLFVAVRGTTNDGHEYISSAIEKGSIAVICEEEPVRPVGDIILVKVKDSAKALAIAAAVFYDNPSSSMKLIGVTGTNGKTTVATLLYRVFRKLGYKCGLFSTICNYIESRELPATHTTPDPVRLNMLMSEMVQEGCDYVFMEISSHAVDQKRIAGLYFAGGIFTNITHDHLDYHKTFENYLAAKKEFFDSLGPDAFALTNADDRNSNVMVQNCKAKKYTFSTRGLADFRAALIEQRFEGMGLKIDGEEVWTRFIGDFNLSNLLAVYSASMLLGAEKDDVLTIMSDLKPVPGRLEIVSTSARITGLVDYAHTPDALENVINTINRIRQGVNQLITVVGAGGDRDRTKRPKMAAIAAAGSNMTILTSDNPRSEDPEKILDDMEEGITPELRNKIMRITNRREAIKVAVMMSNPGDIVLIAGKGHEKYQEIRGVKYHFDDREELAKVILTKI